MKRVVKKGIPFVGFNGVNTNQFKVVEGKKLLDENSVLVSHVPPYGAQDKAFIGIHGGSKELRELVDKFKPKLVLCGHIHEDPGIAKIDNTTEIIGTKLNRFDDDFIKKFYSDKKVKKQDESSIYNESPYSKKSKRLCDTAIIPSLTLEPSGVMNGVESVSRTDDVYHVTSTLRLSQRTTFSVLYMTLYSVSKTSSGKIASNIKGNRINIKICETSFELGNSIIPLI